MNDAVGNTTSFEYFPEGELQSVTDGNNHVTTYSYDVMGRLATRTDPLLRIDTFTYDVNGNPEQWIDRKGQLTGATNDPLNRLRQVTYADSSTIVYTYDSRDRLTNINDSAAGEITRTYDDLDRLTSQVSGSESVAYTYDADDRVSTMTLTGQPAVAYTFDPADRLTAVTRDALSITMTYDDAGRRATLMFPDGVSTEYGYDYSDQLTSVTYRHIAAIIGDLTYGYDAAGRRAEQGGTWSRTILPQAVASATYDSANELTTWATETRRYDANGSLAGRGLTSYAWNSRHRLATIAGDSSVSFDQDATGRRVSVTQSAGTVQYQYDGTNPMVQLKGGQTTVFIAGNAVDDWLGRIDATGAAFFLTDGLGSTVALTRPDGTLVSQYAYEPFGGTKLQSVNDGRIRFTGREDDEDGLYYYRSRYYEPSTGRFLSEDPIQWAGGPNFYSYVNDAPTLFTDPFGLQASTPGSAQAFPDPRPDSSCCDKNQIRQRIASVSGNISRMNRGLQPQGKRRGSNMNVAFCDDMGWCRPGGVPPVSMFQPGCDFSDKCVNYCCRQHEWFHFTDQRPWSIKWSDTAVAIFTEKPAYDIELKCLKSFR